MLPRKGMGKTNPDASRFFLKKAVPSVFLVLLSLVSTGLSNLQIRLQAPCYCAYIETATVYSVI